MRMIRDSPPELARECPGPYASRSNTRFPRFAKCHAVHAPNTPAPITATSYVFCPLIAPASYPNPHLRENHIGHNMGNSPLYRPTGATVISGEQAPPLRCLLGSRALTLCPPTRRAAINWIYRCLSNRIMVLSE